MTKLEAQQLHEIEEGILERVQAADGPYAPKLLRQALRNQGFPDDLIRAAIWFLIDDRRLRFNADRQLLPAIASAAGNG